MTEFRNWPPQQLPFNKKSITWRKKILDWADSKSFNYAPTRNSLYHKIINYDLLNGKIHPGDLEIVLNPNNIKASYIPVNIQHYPIMNSKINVLRGEESKRMFDFRVIVTNPNAISEIENNKKELLFNDLRTAIEETSQDEEGMNASLEKLNYYYTYEWQDIREVRANTLINHYIKELDLLTIFNRGFVDALAVGEEIYQIDIVSGEPVVERINPKKIRAYKMGFSSKLEDADIVVLEDFWSPGKIIDTYYDTLTSDDIKKIESMSSTSNYDGMNNNDERDTIVSVDGIFENNNSSNIDVYSLFTNDNITGTSYYDNFGNIKVLRTYWKSRRKIKKVISFDRQTGEEIINFFPENYIINESLGETETILWINEAWEGTKIGKDIYINMRPRVVQYNRLSNPSRCHFGIVGTIYSMNDEKPFSLVDMMKPYNYLYDIYHDRLNKTMATNWGKLIEIDLALVPKGWTIDKWMHFASVNHLLVKDSFKEGNIGAATGKLAGGLTNNSRGAIDAELGNNIQNLINILEYLKNTMSDIAGISRQREGQISNRETVGGVERATLQSSHITEWLFLEHDSVKKRVLECLLETSKIALKGKSKKFQYILSDMSLKVSEIDGDEFAESDYGLVIDNSSNTQLLNDRLDTLAQAALQNQTLSFSTIMKLYTSTSLAEKQRMVEKDEQTLQERKSQESQQQIDAQNQLAQSQLEIKENEMAQNDILNARDNETKILIASINSRSNDGVNETNESSEELLERIRQFNEKLNLDKEKFSFEKESKRKELEIKNTITSRKPVLSK